MSIQARSAGNTLAGSAIVAGVIGGILVDAFLALVMHKTPLDIWQFVASTLVGPVAFTTPLYAILGCAMHFVISIGWALVYLYVFGAIGQLKNWIVAAIVWGIVVDAVMNGFLAIKIGAPFVPAFTQGLIAHIVFYALPVTWFISRKAR